MPCINLQLSYYASEKSVQPEYLSKESYNFILVTATLDRFWDAANDVSLQYKIITVTPAGCKPQADSLPVMPLLVACHELDPEAVT